MQRRFDFVVENAYGRTSVPVYGAGMCEDVREAGSAGEAYDCA